MEYNKRTAGKKQNINITELNTKLHTSTLSPTKILHQKTPQKMIKPIICYNNSEFKIHF